MLTFYRKKPSQELFHNFCSAKEHKCISVRDLFFVSRWNKKSEKTRSTSTELPNSNSWQYHHWSDLNDGKDLKDQICIYIYGINTVNVIETRKTPNIIRWDRLVRNEYNHRLPWMRRSDWLFIYYFFYSFRGKFSCFLYIHTYIHHSARQTKNFSIMYIVKSFLF